MGECFASNANHVGRKPCRVNFGKTARLYAKGMTLGISPGSTMTVRNLHLGAQPIGGERWYMGGDPYATSFYNALTIVFPPGERFFIESVRPFRKEAPEPLAREIADFIRQEALHTREHECFNDQLRQGGYDTRDCEARTMRVLELERSKGAFSRLGFTICLEHFTAVLAHAMLTNPAHMAQAPESVRQLWHWHALEEIEHKAVAYDTFLWATRNWSGTRRWLFRCRAMVTTTWSFVANTSENMAALMRQDGLSGPSAHFRALAFVFGRNGPGRAVLRSWFSWFRPGFHPWDQDDRALIEEAAGQFATA